MKRIYAVLHGDKKLGADPSLTSEGRSQIHLLRRLLPANPVEVLCGTGRRHHQTCTALALTMTGSTPIIGDPTSLEMTNDGVKVIVFADGSSAPVSEDRSIADISLVARPFVAGLKDNTVLCTGRPFLLALNWSAPSGTVILLEVDDDGGITFQQL